jgi:tRNA(Ile)-lysidine synthase
LWKLDRSYQRLGLRNNSILLAVSGGADSTALLLASSELAEGLGLRLEVCSVNHGWRPEGSQEVRAVAQLAERRGLPFHAAELRLRRGPGAEAQARSARYAAFEEIRQRRNLAFVATAHTADDQAETLLMRLSRGSSLRGARGIRAKRGALVRPMLEITRPEVLAYLQKSGEGWHEDPTNADPAFLRSRVRHQVLTALAAAAGPSTPVHLARFAALCAEENELLEELAAQAYARISSEEGLDATGLRAMPRPLMRRVLAHLLGNSGLEVDSEVLERALDAASRGGSATLPQGKVLRCAGGWVRCVCPTTAQRLPSFELAMDQVVVAEPFGYRFALSQDKPRGIGALGLGPGAALPLTIRARQPRDRVATASGRSRKLQDALVDLKIRAEERDRIPVVVDRRSKVVWVPGQPAARRALGPPYLSARKL